MRVPSMLRRLVPSILIPLALAACSGGGGGGGPGGGGGGGGAGSAPQFAFSAPTADLSGTWLLSSTIGDECPGGVELEHTWTIQHVGGALSVTVDALPGGGTPWLETFTGTIGADGAFTLVGFQPQDVIVGRMSVPTNAEFADLVWIDLAFTLSGQWGEGCPGTTQTAQVLAVRGTPAAQEFDLSGAWAFDLAELEDSPHGGVKTPDALTVDVQHDLPTNTMLVDVAGLGSVAGTHHTHAGSWGGVVSGGSRNMAFWFVATPDRIVGFGGLQDASNGVFFTTFVFTAKPLAVPATSDGSGGELELVNDLGVGAPIEFAWTSPGRAPRARVLGPGEVAVVPVEAGSGAVGLVVPDRRGGRRLVSRTTWTDGGRLRVRASSFLGR